MTWPPETVGVVVPVPADATDELVLDAAWVLIFGECARLDLAPVGEAVTEEGWLFGHHARRVTVGAVHMHGEYY